MKSKSESKKGERLIRGASTSGLAAEEPPGRPGNGWRGLGGSIQAPQPRKSINERVEAFVRILHTAPIFLAPFCVRHCVHARQYSAPLQSNR